MVDNSSDSIGKKGSMGGIYHYISGLLTRKGDPNANIGVTEASRIALYDHKDADEVQWPSNDHEECIRKFLTPIVKQGIHTFIDNINSDIQLLAIDDIVLPVTIIDENYTDSFVCSPYGHFISYSLDSIESLTKNEWIVKSVKAIVQFYGYFLKRGKLNKCVLVNNWPYSTDLYPNITIDKLRVIQQFLEQRFPNHAIIYRSINKIISKDLYQSLHNLNYTFIASKQVYYTNAIDEHISQTRIMKSDFKLLRECGYEIVDVNEATPDEIERMIGLYNAVFLQKYSKLNPQFNVRFLKLAMDSKLFHFKILKKDGEIDGVVGFMCNNGILFCPFFGYDTSKSQHIGLYRLLSTILFLEAKHRGVLYYQSSGASFYRKIRRAESCIDHYAVYLGHLSFFRKMPWYWLKALFNTVGIHFMKKY